MKQDRDRRDDKMSKKEYTVDIAVTVESKTGEEAIQEARKLIAEGYGAAEADEVIE